MGSILSTIYGVMKNEDRVRYKKLLAHEINFFLKKMHDKLGVKQKLTPIHVHASQIRIKAAASGNTKPYEFVLASPDEIIRGNIGHIITITNGINVKNVRKQRALFIAAEIFVYRAFANNKNPSHFDKIRNQNQYIDLLKTVIGKESASKIRDHAIRYVIAEIGAHRLAHYTEKGWITRVTKLKKHQPRIAALLGSSEEAYRHIRVHQKHSYTRQMLEEELDSLNQEIEEIDHLTAFLKEQKHKELDLIQEERVIKHMTDLEGLRAHLVRVKLHQNRWNHQKRPHHKAFRDINIDSIQHIGQLIDHELRHEKIDMPKIYILLQQFENEKINILKETEKFRNRKLKPYAVLV
ncbi:hypothetical protein HZB03_02585 [Candidatus Woesearchaeota archaeon]|nr:hypothetical protein [Candidatus Woesearchaeota archaeon]